MFYSAFVLVQQGGLSTVWMAATYEKKLKKAQILATDIDLSAASIQDSATPMALRLSGQLLLGLVRIYSKKVKYLHEEAQDAVAKIKLMQRKGARVTLDESEQVANAHTITLRDDEGMILELPNLNLMDNIDDFLRQAELDMDASFDVTDDRVRGRSRSRSRSRTRDEKAPGTPLRTAPKISLSDMEELDQPLTPKSTPQKISDFDMQMDVFGEDVFAGVDWNLDLGSQSTAHTREDEKSALDVSTPGIARRAAEVDDLAPMDLGPMDDFDKNASYGEATPLQRPKLVESPESQGTVASSETEGKEEKVVAEKAKKKPETAEEKKKRLELEAKREERKAKQLEAKKRKKIEEGRDTKSEIAREVMKSWHEDTTDIVRRKGPSVSVTKQARIAQMLDVKDTDKNWFDTFLSRPALAGSLAERETLAMSSRMEDMLSRDPGMAPEFLSLFADAAKPVKEITKRRKTDVKEKEKKSKKETEGKEEQEEAVPEKEESKSPLLDALMEVPDLPPIDQEFPMDDYSTVGTAGSREDSLFATPRKSLDDSVFDLGAEPSAKGLTPGKTPLKEMTEADYRRQEALEDAEKATMASFFAEKIAEPEEEEMPEGKEEKRTETPGSWSKRTAKMHQLLKNKLSGKTQEIGFQNMVTDGAPSGPKRHLAAGIFYQLLVLKSHQYIDIEQEEAFGDITIRPDKNFKRPAPKVSH